jgi:protein-S-isoprenylcysteine O-methyltransferase Ste14
MSMLAALFLAGTLAITVFSRRSLLRPNSHGFYRYLTFETLLGLLLLNIRTWFRDATAWYQIVSWLLLGISLFLVIAALRMLHASGARDESRRDPSLLKWEKTSRLITGGVYRYVRHPMYGSLLLLRWGIFFKSPSLRDAALAALCTALLISTARSEERENIAYFGNAYVLYMQRTPRFIPFLF